jgi:uncharacterized membrane protein YhfC
MIGGGALAGLALSALLSIGAPFALYFTLRKRMTLSWANIGIGAATFFVAALVLEQILHYVVLVHPSGLSAFVKATKPVFVVYAVLAAGIVEETGRYIAMRFLVQRTGHPGTAVAYGLGHGGLESILTGGLGMLSALTLALLFNDGVLQQFIVGPKAMPTLTQVHAQFLHLTFFTASIAGLERLIAIGLHIALSLMVWRAVALRRIGFLFLAIVLHALADTGAAMFQARIFRDVVPAEFGALAVLALIAVLLRFLPKPVLEN